MDSSPDNMSKKELLELVNQLEKKNSEIQKAKDNLQFHYDQLRRLVFGTKRERFIASANPFQQTLPFEELEDENQEPSKTVKETVTYVT
jgi:transposase